MAPPKKRKQAEPKVGIASVQRSNTPIVIAIAAVVIVIAIVVTVIAIKNSGESDGPDTSVSQYRGVSVEGTNLPTASTDAADTTIGTPAPAVEGEDFAGDAVNITNDGKAKAIMFFAHWCPHCQREAPVLGSWIQENGDKYDVDFYAVATGTSSSSANYPPSDWLKGLNWPTPVLADDRQNTAATAFGLSSYPYLVFIGADGNIVSRTSGEIGADQFDAYVAAAAGAGAAPAADTGAEAESSPAS